ncbi:MAG: hypothetical protein PHC64_09255 [Candidatus Gastranaerophilales bacterium]|nr:hypothetical protein [Candidatus Gastranaerophilales bacterium]
MEFFNSIQQIRANWQPYKKWEAEQDDKEFRRQELHKRFPASEEELQKASQYGRTLIDSINVMDQYSINKAEDVEMASEVGLEFVSMVVGAVGLALGGIAYKNSKLNKFIDKLLVNTLPSILADDKFITNMFKFELFWAAASILLSIITMPYFMLKAKSYEKEASRIARYQAREEELKDPENFVVYDAKQINEAKEIAKTLPEPPKKKKKSTINPITNYNESINSIKSLLEGHKNYLKWKEENQRAEKAKTDSFETTETTPEQLENAKRDQDNLTRIIRKIEIYSQNYLANSEMAINIVASEALLGGAISGGIVSGLIMLLQKLKVIPKEAILANSLKRLLAPIGSFVGVMATVSYIIKFKKETAKIGRFKAKQELLNDPNNFITYSDKQQESVKDLKVPSKAKKGFWAKSKDDIKFFLQLKKDYEEYEKYQKTGAKEEQKLQQALKKVEVSNEQMQEAKALQKNAFMAFEKIDEMTQRYVDDTEAATDIVVQQWFYPIVNLIASIFLMKNTQKMIKSSSGNEGLVESLGKMINLQNFWPFFLAGFIQLPAEIESIRIKKEAGRIGTMKAMQDLEDPRHFVQNGT